MRTRSTLADSCPVAAIDMTDVGPIAVVGRWQRERLELAEA